MLKWLNSVEILSNSNKTTVYHDRYGKLKIPIVTDMLLSREKYILNT